MEPNPLIQMMKRPTAFLPTAMSLAALIMVLVSVARYGAGHPGDEGAVAHLWQLLMAGQVPIIVFFAVKWLPKARTQTLLVLAEQAAAAGASLAAVFFLKLG